MAVRGDAATSTAPHCVPYSTWTGTHVPEGGQDGQTEVWKGERRGGKENTTGVSHKQTEKAG